MNKQNAIQMEIEELLRKSSNHTIIEIVRQIDAKRSQIIKLLENGRPIFDTAYGSRYFKLYRQRNKLWIKVSTIDQCISIMLDYLQ